MSIAITIKTRPCTIKPIPPCPAPGAGVHTWLMEAAWACRANGLTSDQAAEELATTITRQEAPREIEEAVAKVYDSPDRPMIATNYRRPLKATYKPDRLTELARRMDGFEVADLVARSPIYPEFLTPAEFLHHLYLPGEKVIIFSTYKSQGQELVERPDEGEDFDPAILNPFIRPKEGEGVWFLANPVDGEYRDVERLGKRSRRCEECVTSFRYLVLESDQADAELWIAGLVQIPLPIVAVYSSGGKSIHALVRVDAENVEHWREIKRKLAPALVTLGADDAAMTAVRLTRLPQCYRGKTERWQELYYLNPAADETPIAQLPVK
jgi:hypothetical protein